MWDLYFPPFTVESGERAMLPTNQQLRWVNLTRFVLPIILFSIVFLYESWEHILLPGAFRWDLHLSAEVLFFGILGPAAVFIVLSRMVSLLDAQITTSRQLEALNRSLEKQVIERTRELVVRNQELAQANVELQELDRLKSDFVSLVSHELRAPLTTLNGGLELALQQAASLPAETRKTLETMSRESERLTYFVQIILDVSRLDAGQLRLHPGPVAVIPLLKRAVEVVISSSGRPIEWNLCPDLPPLWADEIYLEEIVRNLLRNADKYSPGGLPILISACCEENDLCIRVGDCGPGVPAELQSHIFERFYRGPGTQYAPGWGLGLYFARRITESLGGKLTLSSPRQIDSQHPGAEFCLTLPVVADTIEEENA